MAAKSSLTLSARFSPGSKYRFGMRRDPSRAARARRSLRTSPASTPTVTVTPLMNRLGRALQFFRPDADRLAVVGLFLLLGIGANLLKPWPLAVIVDSVLGDKPVPAALRALSSPAQKETL